MTIRLLLLALTFLFAMGCKRASDMAPAYAATALTDSALYAEADQKTGFVWYRGDSSRRRSASSSGHLRYMRVRYNQIAAAALTDSGRLPIGGRFPEGSLIVKELFADSAGSGPFALLAVMKKEPTNPNAANGWVWGEYLPQLVSDYIRLDGKGAACTTCHSMAGNRDYARLFDPR